MNCPWNGRVWPMTNSHIAEAIACTALRFNDTDLRRRAAEFISRFVRMMFFDGDARRPNCFKHCTPFTRIPSMYRGVDDYQHSWIVDLIIKYVCGIRPDASHIVIDPLPFGLKHARIDNVHIRDLTLSVEIRGKHFSVRIDRARHVESTLGKPIVIRLL